jgi:hypothetical protein
MAEMHATQEIHDYLREVVQTATPLREMQRDAMRMIHEASLLQAMRDAPAQPDRAVMVIRPLAGESEVGLDWLVHHYRYRQLWEDGFSLQCSRLPSAVRLADSNAAVLSIAGPHVWPLVSREAGTYLLCRPHETLVPIQIVALPVAAGSDDESVAQDLFDAERAWIEDLARGEATVADDPFPIGPVLRVTDEQGGTIDIRTGLTIPHTPTADELRTLILAALPLPQELCRY